MYFIKGNFKAKISKVLGVLDTWGLGFFRSAIRSISVEVRLVHFLTSNYVEAFNRRYLLQKSFYVMSDLCPITS